MTSRNPKKGLELFEDVVLDPMAVATGSDDTPPADKRKAGFYLPVDLLERFDRKFYELKLSGANVANKSAFLEAVLRFALEDMDRGSRSRLLQAMAK
ncbi:MAG TPA: hypothetical protein ENF48_11365 [Desulfobacteraceae bacterium]|nr:hypothetical protein [Deltaproteobacteria bacterium]MBW2356167.1 hypothetical protein [Deltaproteobacteria bacterium]RLB96500.1 MAG: hypothetical protein DRH76_06685 [Deltaproteobacteria bacterium]HDI60931.1 hypothetical protein [Desulfobacteraceae bacterium]